MSVIKVPFLYAGSKGEKHLYTLFDSGANLSCINPEYCMDWKMQSWEGPGEWLQQVKSFYRDNRSYTS
jgi:hypothetical protein